MIAAAHLDNFLFLIFFAVAILFQLLTRAASKSGRRGSGDQKQTPTAPSQNPRPMAGPSQDSEEDRIRKFLEALGQPSSSQPPPPVAQRPAYPKPIVLPRVEPRQIARRVLAPLPPLTTRPSDFEPAESQVPPPTPKRERRVFQPKSEIPSFEVQQAASPQAPITDPGAAVAKKAARPVSQPDARIDIPTLLRSSSGLRNAIILREIFGPPRSMQPLDLIGNV